MRVHTGSGDDTGTTGATAHVFTFWDVFWDFDDYVWNNNGDVAKLRNRSGDVVDK